MTSNSLDACPQCGATLPRRAAWRSIPTGHALALLGGFAVLAAYFMPWFGTQGLVLTGHLLDRFLASTSDLRSVMPGATGGPAEVAALRVLVNLFPVSGALAACCVVVSLARRRVRRVARVLACLLAATALVALLGGVSRLPAGASYEIGLWLIGAGAAAILAGTWIDRRI